MKKKILFIVRRGLLEIEYVMPILQKISSSYDIYTIFLNYKSYKSLKVDPYLFSKWNKLNKEFYIQKKFHFLFLKILNQILDLINIKKLITIKKFINSKLHNPRVLINKVKLNDLNKIKYIFTEYGNFSIWIKNFYESATRPKIIFFPSSPHIFLNNLNHKVNQSKKKLYGDLLLNVSDKDKNYWSHYIDKKKIIPIGVPYFSEKIFDRIKKKKKKKTILIGLNDPLVISKKDFFQKLKLVFDNLVKLKNINIVVKPHPFKNSQELKSLILSYKRLYKNFFVSNKLIKELCKTSDVMVSNLQTSAIVYGLLYRLPIISFPFKDYEVSPTDNEKNGLILKTNSISNFLKIVDLALYKTNSHVWIDQQKKFRDCYFKKKCSINQIIRIIENYKYERNNQKFL